MSIVDTAEMRNPHYHRPTGTIASLDLDFALSVTRWAGAATLTLAGVKAQAGLAPSPSLRAAERGDDLCIDWGSRRARAA
jgi:hypothetical protein